MIKKLSLAIVASVLVAMGAQAQSRSALRINEVMVENTNSVIDDYGNYTAWVELFNANFAPLEISSVYLTTDSLQPKMYPVPLGDVNTRIPKRQHVIFWADNEPNKGTFHTSFVLVPGQDNWIGIYDADGKTLIDQVLVPASLKAGESYARVEDAADKWEVRTGGQEDYITPSSANRIKDTNDKVEMFAEKDSLGAGITIMAMGIVFTALLVLCLAFYAIGEIGKYSARLNKAKATGANVADITRDENDSGEQIAAVIMALHEHFNAHDQESNLLTIRKIKRAYSPWSSKIYNLRQLPRH